MIAGLRTMATEIPPRDDERNDQLEDFILDTTALARAGILASEVDLASFRISVKRSLGKGLFLIRGSASAIERLLIRYPGLAAEKDIPLGPLVTISD
jgi:hypothetical protein